MLRMANTRAPSLAVLYILAISACIHNASAAAITVPVTTTSTTASPSATTSLNATAPTPSTTINQTSTTSTTSSNPTVTTTLSPAKSTANSSSTTGQSSTSSVTSDNCLLFATNVTLLEEIKSKLSSAKLLRFTLTIDGSNRLVSANGDISRMYNPLHWERSTGRQGDGLLMLRPDFGVLSLFTLNIEVHKFTVPLTSQPTGCVSNLNYAKLEDKLRNLVLNKFENVSGTSVATELGSTESVCNQHILDADGTASFPYYCCKQNATNGLSCGYMKKDNWVEMILIIVKVLQIGVALFVPMLIPESLYRKKFIAEPYKHKLKQALSLSAVVTRSPQHFTNVKNVVKLCELNLMSKFRETVHDMEEDVPTQLTIKKVHFNTKCDRLQNSDEAPIGLFRTMFDSFFRCEIRRRYAVKECCDSRIFVKICGNKGMGITWYTALREMMKLVMIVAISVPWMIRVYVYYKHEEDDVELRKQYAQERGLTVTFSGNFVLYLSPLHIVFIVVYVILLAEALIYGVIGKETQERLKLVVRKCLRDMHEVNKMTVAGWFVRLSLKPFVRYGASGLFLGLLTWFIGLPIMVIITCFYIFPTVNLTFRLLGHFAVYLVPRGFCTNNKACNRISRFLDDIERKFELEELSSTEKLQTEDSFKTFGKRLQQIVVIILCLISLYSVIFLVTEMVAFVIEICIYTLMGVIVNAGTTLSYLSLFLLLWAYSHQVFGAVRDKFLSFNATLNGTIAGLGKDETSEVMFQPASEQGNNAYIVQTERNEKVPRSVELVSGINGELRWKFSRLLLFLDKHDQTLIPTKFYFNACKLPFYGVPGELLISYLKAFIEFGSIVVFLMFVLIVVLAFGDTYKLSATNRTLATIAGGFLPLIVRKLLAKSRSTAPLDTSSVAFQVCLDKAIEDYEQSWIVDDIRAEVKQADNGVPASEKTSENGGTAVIEVNETDDQPSMASGGNQVKAAEVQADNSRSGGSSIEAKASSELDLLVILPGPKYVSVIGDSSLDVQACRDDVQMTSV